LLGAPEQPDFGGVARFKTLVDQLRRDARSGPKGQARRHGAVMLSSGDNFLAGPEFTAGGGDELLANEDDLLVPGDTLSVDPVTGEPLRYPIYERDKTGRRIPIVTTAGDYKYVVGSSSTSTSAVA